MSIQMVDAADTAERVRSCTLAGSEGLGVDGFQIIPERVSAGFDSRVPAVTA